MTDEAVQFADVVLGELRAGQVKSGQEGDGRMPQVSGSLVMPWSRR